MTASVDGPLVRSKTAARNTKSPKAGSHHVRSVREEPQRCRSAQGQPKPSVEKSLLLRRVVPCPSQICKCGWGVGGLPANPPTFLARSDLSSFESCSVRRPNPTSPRPLMQHAIARGTNSNLRDIVWANPEAKSSYVLYLQSAM